MKSLVQTERILICLLRMLNKPVEVKDESIPDTTTPKPTRRCPSESAGIAGGDSPIKCPPPLFRPQPVEAVMIPPQLLPKSLPRGMLSSRMTEAPRDIVEGIFLPKPSRSRTCVNTSGSGKENRFTPWKDKSNVKTSFDIEESVTEPSEASDLIDVLANTQRIPIPRLHLNYELHRSGFLTAPLAGVTRNSTRAAPVDSSPDTKMQLPPDQKSPVAIMGLKPVSQTPEAQSIGLKTPAGPQRMISRLSKACAPQNATNKDVEQKISTSQHQVLINSNSRNPAPPSVKQMSKGDSQVDRRISCSSRLVSSGAFSLSHQQPSVQKSSAVGIRGFVAKSTGCLPPRFKASVPEPVAGGTSPGWCFSPSSGTPAGRQIEPAAPKPAMSRAKPDFRDRTMSFSPTGRMIPFTRSETTRTDNPSIPRVTAGRINQIPSSRKVAARQGPPCITRNSIGEPPTSEDPRPTTGRETIGMYHTSSVMYGNGSVGNSSGKNQALYSGERNSFGFTCKRRAEAKPPTNAAQKTS